MLNHGAATQGKRWSAKPRGAGSADALDNTFQIAFPVVGLSSSFAVFFLLRFYEHESSRWAVVSLVGGLHALLFIVPTYGSQLGAAIVFGLLRTLQWGAYFYALSDRTHIRGALYARVLGYNNLAIAIVSDLLPYTFAAMVLNSDNHAALYFATKLGILLLFMVATSSFYYYLYWAERFYDRGQPPVRRSASAPLAPQLSSSS